MLELPTTTTEKPSFHHLRLVDYRVEDLIAGKEARPIARAVVVPAVARVVARSIARAVVVLAVVRVVARPIARAAAVVAAVVAVVAVAAVEDRS